MYVNHETFDDADRHLHALSGWIPTGYFGDFACSNASALYWQLQSAEALKAYGAGTSYAFGPATIALTYTHNRLEHSQYFANARTRKAETSRRYRRGERNVRGDAFPAIGLAYLQYREGGCRIVDALSSSEPPRELCVVQTHRAVWRRDHAEGSGRGTRCRPGDGRPGQSRADSQPS